jgi:hypothetical protein
MFVFRNLADFGNWLKQQADEQEVQAKTSSKLRDQYHHRSQKAVYQHLADMIKSGQVILKTEEDRLVAR